MPKRFAIHLLALAAGALPGHVLAGELKPVLESALAEMRGGFVSVGGLTFDIGITTTTYINGRLAANTSVTTAPTAPTGPTGPTSPTAAVTPAALPVAANPSSSGGPVATASADPAPAPTAGQSGGAPVVSPSSAGAGSQPVSNAAASPGPTIQIVTTATPGGGQTTVIQDPSKLVNLVTNTANGQDIRLDTQVNLVLPGFDAVQRNQLLSGMGMKIGADGSFGIVSALPH